LKTTEEIEDPKSVTATLVEHFLGEEELNESPKYPRSTSAAYMAGARFAKENRKKLTRGEIEKARAKTQKIITKMVSSIGGDFGRSAQKDTDAIIDYVYLLWYYAGILESL